MITVQTNLITSDTIQKIKERQKIDFEKLGSWIVAGSGNYEKIQDDGRYRKNCNTFKDAITCKDHKVKYQPFLPALVEPNKDLTLIDSISLSFEFIKKLFKAQIKLGNVSNFY